MPNAASNSGAKPIVLAYSGGLDTSFLVPWLEENYGRPIITVTVDTGGIDAAGAKTLAERSKALGAIEHHHDRRARRLLRAGAALPDHGQRAPRPALSAVRGRGARDAGADDRAHGAQARHEHDRARLHGRRQRPGALRSRDAHARAGSRSDRARARQGVQAPGRARVPAEAQPAGAAVRRRVLDQSRPVGRHHRRQGNAHFRGQHPRYRLGAVEGRVHESEARRSGTSSRSRRAARSARRQGDVARSRSSSSSKRWARRSASAAAFTSATPSSAPRAAWRSKRRPRKRCSPRIASWRSSCSRRASSASRSWWPARTATWVHEGQLLDPVCRDIEALLLSSQERVTGNVHVLLPPGQSVHRGRRVAVLADGRLERRVRRVGGRMDGRRMRWVSRRSFRSRACSIGAPASGRRKVSDWQCAVSSSTRSLRSRRPAAFARGARRRRRHPRRGRRGRGRRGAEQQVHLQHARAHERPHGQGGQGRHRRRRARPSQGAVRLLGPRAREREARRHHADAQHRRRARRLRLGESRQGQAVRLPRASAACCISRTSASASACRRASAIAGSIRTRSSTRSGVPVVALAGTCMEAGKTAAACAIVSRMRHRGLVVDAFKATGVSLRRDILAMEDAGARNVAHLHGSRHRLDHAHERARRSRARCSPSSRQEAGRHRVRARRRHPRHLRRRRDPRVRGHPRSAHGRGAVGERSGRGLGRREAAARAVRHRAVRRHGPVHRQQRRRARSSRSSSACPRSTR